MTTASTPVDRRNLLVDAIVTAREHNTQVAFIGAGNKVEYSDRILRLELNNEEQDRLDTLRVQYPVFKPKQPDTRKAPDNVLYLSAVTDPKHVADFLDDLFLDVFDASSAYELEVT